jgi:Holliday junction resolvase
MITELIKLDIEADVVTSLPAIQFDKTRYIVAIDNMALEDITPKFLKSIKDAAIAIDKRLSTPIKEWRVAVDEIIAHAESRIAELKAKKAEAEKLRVAEKTEEVEALLKWAKESSGLPAEYQNKIIFKPEYTQVTFVGSKLNIDIQAQVDNAKALKKGADDAAELDKIKIANRELLIEKLNAQYEFDVKYSQLPYTSYNDEEVTQFYIAKAEKMAINTKTTEKVEPRVEPIVEQPKQEVKPDTVSVTIKLTAKDMVTIRAIIDRIDAVPGIQVTVVNV